MQDIREQPVLKALCVAICYYGQAKESDFLDELLRQLQKPLPGDPITALGNADLHRLVKEMIKAEISGAKDPELHLCQSVASILLKNFE